MQELDDFPVIDVRTFSPEQMDRLVQAGMRRGMRERSRLFRSSPRHLWALLRRAGAALRAALIEPPLKGEKA